MFLSWWQCVTAVFIITHSLRYLLEVWLATFAQEIDIVWQGICSLLSDLTFWFVFRCVKFFFNFLHYETNLIELKFNYLKIFKDPSLDVVILEWSVIIRNILKIHYCSSLYTLNKEIHLTMSISFHKILK